MYLDFKLIWPQNHILRIIFGLQKFESVSKVKENLIILNTPELHLYGLIEVLSKVLRQDSPNYFLNDTINKFELENVLKGDAIKTELKLLVKSTKNKNKSLVTRVRNIFNAFAKLDIKIIERSIKLSETTSSFFT